MMMVAAAVDSMVVTWDTTNKPSRKIPFAHIQQVDHVIFEAAIYSLAQKKFKLQLSTKNQFSSDAVAEIKDTDLATNFYDCRIDEISYIIRHVYRMKVQNFGATN